MTNEEIIEGNILIAEFMGLRHFNPLGYSLRRDGSENYFVEFPKYENIQFNNLVQEDDVHYYLKFHSSWDWLMNVVEQIESLPCISTSYYFNVRISQGYIEIEGLIGEKIFRNSSIENGKINALWLAIVDFIKLFNNRAK